MQKFHFFKEKTNECLGLFPSSVVSYSSNQIHLIWFFEFRLASISSNSWIKSDIEIFPEDYLLISLCISSSEEKDTVRTMLDSRFEDQE